MKIVVAGTGYVGLVAGVCFAEKGHNVTCVDTDKRKVELMEKGISPIYEKDLEELMRKNYAAGRLHYTTDFQKAYKDPVQHLSALVHRNSQTAPQILATLLQFPGK